MEDIKEGREGWIYLHPPRKPSVEACIPSHHRSARVRHTSSYSSVDLLCYCRVAVMDNKSNQQRSQNPVTDLYEIKLYSWTLVSLRLFRFLVLVCFFPLWKLNSSTWTTCS